MTSAGSTPPLSFEKLLEESCFLHAPHLCSSTLVNTSSGTLFENLLAVSQLSAQDMYSLADFLVKNLPEICTPLPEHAQPCRYTCSQDNVFAENVDINQSLLDKFDFPFEGVDYDFAAHQGDATIEAAIAEEEVQEQASPPSSIIDSTTINTSNIFEAFPPSAILAQTQQFGALFSNFIDESQFPDDLNMAKFYFSGYSNPPVETFMECEDDTDGSSSVMESYLFCSNNNDNNNNFDNFVLNSIDDKSSKNRSSRSADKHCSSSRKSVNLEENVRYTPYPIPDMSKYPSPEIALDLLSDMEKHSDSTNGLVTPPLYNGDIVYSMPTLPMPSLPINNNPVGCAKEDLFNYEQQQQQQLSQSRRPSAVSVNGRRKRQSQIDCGPTFDTEGKPIPICKWGDCRQVFDTMENLVNHVDVCHVESGKPFYHCGWMSCERNGKPFPKRHKLFTHLRTHTGERPYPCTVPNCGRWFSRSDSLNSHKKVKHGIGI